MATLGQKLRELRHQKGYKLNEVADGADLSISFISLIERDKASISVENLHKLANFYNVRLFQIFQDIEEEEAYIVRDEEIKDWRNIGSPDKLALILLSPEDNLSFKAIQALVPPGSEYQHFKVQKGETFIFVKEGQIEVNVPNKNTFKLEQGDSAHLTSFKGTLIKNASENLPAKLLIVASTTTESLDRQGNLLTYHELTK